MGQMGQKVHGGEEEGSNVDTYEVGNYMEFSRDNDNKTINW